MNDQYPKTIKAPSTLEDERERDRRRYLRILFAIAIVSGACAGVLSAWFTFRIVEAFHGRLIAVGAATLVALCVSSGISYFLTHRYEPK